MQIVVNIDQRAVSDRGNVFSVTGWRVMAVQGLILQDGFAHRLNKDGTADSICLFCYARVATLTNESELSAAEAIHHCWRGNDRAWNLATQRTDA